MLGIIFSAAVLGLIIAVMEEGEFPGWFPMIVCVLSASLPAALVNSQLPPEFFLVGLAAGAVCAALAITATCGMGFQRAVIAAALYLGIQTVLSLGFLFLLT